MKTILFILISIGAYAQTVSFEKTGNDYKVSTAIVTENMSKQQALAYLDSLIYATKIELGITQEWEYTYADSISSIDTIQIDSLTVIDTSYISYVVDSQLVDVQPVMELDTLLFDKINRAIERLQNQKEQERLKLQEQRQERQRLRAIIQEYRSIKQQIRSS